MAITMHAKILCTAALFFLIIKSIHIVAIQTSITQPEMFISNGRCHHSCSTLIKCTAAKISVTKPPIQWNFMIRLLGLFLNLFHKNSMHSARKNMAVMIPKIISLSSICNHSQYHSKAVVEKFLLFHFQAIFQVSLLIRVK